MTEVFALPETLSPSGTGTFQNCPLQFRFQNIQKLPQPPGAAAVKGNVVHRALELLFGLEPALRTEEAALEAMLTISAQPLLFTTLRFGKYNGKKLSMIVHADRDYLEWLLREKEKDPAAEEDWIYTLKHYLKG